MIRKATMQDAREIHRLLLEYSRDGLVLPRSLAEIYESIREFVIAECEGRPMGVAGLNICWDNLAEIRSLVVDPRHHRQGIGRHLVQACLDEARALGITRVFALTYQREFFQRLGFVEIEKAALPHKVWGDCVRCAKFPDCDELAFEISLSPQTS